MRRVCPMCNRGSLTEQRYSTLNTVFENALIRVKKAVYDRCSRCESRIFTAKEIKRWRTLRRRVKTNRPRV